MKFKMPRNSIFAVLLRSPWWISAAIAALLSAGGFAALPLEYAAMGVFAAIPFAVIAIMAAWKQLRARPRRACRPWRRPPPRCPGRIFPARFKPASSVTAARSSACRRPAPISP